MFPSDAPQVLIASVSAHEQHSVEASLAGSGLATRPVAAAVQAAQALDPKGSPPVLVIDAGLLEARHDAQWRAFRALYPGLGAVVRCLIPPGGGSRRKDERTFLVHPDDAAGMRRAVQQLLNGGH